MQRVSKRTYFMRRILVALAALVLLSGAVYGAVRLIGTLGDRKNVLAVPPPPKQWENVSPSPDISGDFLQSLDRFSLSSAYAILSAQPRSRNVLYSPISLYMALAMLAECAEGTAQEEIITALEMEPFLSQGGNLAAATDELFQSLHFQRDSGKLHLSNSLWLDKTVTPDQPVLDRLASQYHAYTMSVDFGSKRTEDKLAKWIGDETDGMVDSFPVDPNTRAILLNTTLFADRWQQQFDPENTREMAFYLANGGEVTCPFLHQKADYAPSLETDEYLTSYLEFASGFRLHLILPHPDVDPLDILRKADLVQAALDVDSNPSTVVGETYFYLPKVDFKSSLDCVEAAKQMGIQAAFETDANLMEAGLSVTDIQQNTAFAMDEQGAKAGAATQIAMESAAAVMDEPVKLILDRPFLLFLTSTEGRILFAGVVNAPTAE